MIECRPKSQNSNIAHDDAEKKNSVYLATDQQAITNKIVPY
jgi:hypothetical protein